MSVLASFRASPDWRLWLAELAYRYIRDVWLPRHRARVTAKLKRKYAAGR